MEASADCACDGTAKSTRPRARRASLFVGSFLSGGHRELGIRKPPQPIGTLTSPVCRGLRYSSTLCGKSAQNNRAVSWRATRDPLGSLWGGVMVAADDAGDFPGAI